MNYIQAVKRNKAMNRCIYKIDSFYYSAEHSEWNNVYYNFSCLRTNIVLSLFALYHRGDL